jgi:carboxyl-terminal processing protease
MGGIRNVIKGFLGCAIVGAAFMGGFTADTLKEFVSNPAAARYRLETVPPAKLADLLRPAIAQAQSDDLPPVETYEAVLRTLRAHYYSGDAAGDRDKLGVTRLTHAAVHGMLKAVGDPYTVYYTPKEYREMLEDQSGNFVGIGARLDTDNNHRVIITEPIEGSPAEAAGIQSGDVIIAVEGKSVLHLRVDDVIERIRGEEGTYVRLTVQRKNRPISFTLKRTLIQSPVVEWNMADEASKIGYIKLWQFNEEADRQFDAAVSRLEKRGMRALVFDLRDNPGGLFNVAQDISSRFLRSGAVVWVKERSGPMLPSYVDTSKHRGKLSTGAYPVVVLVNGSSASASEIVAGAIQDAKAGVLVGTRTYGKGLVQTIYPLADDSAVKITTQHYFTRNKHDINVKHDADGKSVGGTGGIVPDIVVPFTDAQMAAQQEQERREPRNKAASQKLDPQLQKALQVARTRLVQRPGAFQNARK